MVGVSNFLLRIHHHTEPCISLVPPLVLMLTSEPWVWPIPASYIEVCTLNSPIEACGGENATRTCVLSENVLGTPSIVNSLLYVPPPSVENCDGALLKGALRRRISVVFTAPGAISSNS